MLDQMTHLFRLSKIVEAGSMRKASNDLNVTQPALSRSIAKLEERFGKNILIRHIIFQIQTEIYLYYFSK